MQQTSIVPLVCVRSFNNLPDVIPIVVTLVTEEGGSEELLQEVQKEMETIGEELSVGVNITVSSVDRFGKIYECSMNDYIL